MFWGMVKIIKFVLNKYSHTSGLQSSKLKFQAFINKSRASEKDFFFLKKVIFTETVRLGRFWCKINDIGFSRDKEANYRWAILT
tara:strand:+ start:2234 stop:2485 length:252 start_codon:yes stop_codon:yes gene_type:complete